MRSPLLSVVVMAAVLAGCASAPPPEPAAVGADDWMPMPLPGKEKTRYEWSEKDGRRAIMARSERSASMWRKRLQPVRQAVGEVRFSWWIQDVIAGADLTDADRGDAPARVMFAFDGDVGSLPLRTRMLFEVAQALTGEQPPYATLMYVWDAHLPVGTVVVNPRSDRVRSIVVDSGPAELRRWRDHRRDLAADFRHAFSEEPGPLTSVALMTDSDNTRSQARAWYGPVELQ
ncbi:DUF3047 domain-containing protein [Ideonella sp. YS5]|uniref:DUF3047 domain-containing protein n=1 Tax=Ideonella sp. YS5 TaxID=3453714 RepID=UPI003EE95D60